MTENSPKAIHLAAGQGTRLRPITNDRPKPLVELGDKSLLERNVETLRAVGVDDQLSITGYRADQIRNLGYDTVHNPIYDETEMVYSLFCAEDYFPENRDLFISYGDIIYEKQVVELLLECTAPLCVVVDYAWEELWEQRFDDPLDDAETLQIDDDGRIREIGSEPEDIEDIEGQYIGLLKIRDDHVEEFTEVYRDLSNDGSDAVEMTHFVQHLIDTGWDVQSVPIEGNWLEVDTIADLEFYQEQLEKKKAISHVSWIDN